MGRPEYFVLVPLVLYFCVYMYGGMVYSESKLETACLQLKNMSCGGRFITWIDIKCSGQGHINEVEHGHSCNHSEECMVRGSVCYTGICLCRLGRYFSPKQNACVTECREYGEKMDIYKGASIKGNNIKTFSIKNVTRCCEMCVKEKTFICLTMDINEGVYCHLSDVGYLDVKEEQREIGLQVWSLAQRRCDHGKNCSRNEECTIVNSVCFAGICLCRLGLYFSPQQNACLKECREYGEKMDIYKGASIKGNNIKTFSIKNVTRCCEMCVKAKTFICLTMDINEGVYCHLSGVGYLDVKEEQREIGLHGWSLAQRRCDHGKNCSRNEECTIVNSVCFARICLCRLGLYFSPQQNACLKECHEYGENMDIYKGAGIRSHNERSLGIPSVARCCEMCVKEKNFTCLTMDIKNGMACYLSRVGYLDVKEEYREVDVNGWSFAQRRCK